MQENELYIARIAAGARLRARDHVVSAVHGDNTVLLDPYNEHYYSLTGSGGHIWALLCDGTTVKEITHTLALSFELPCTGVVDDVTQLCERMLRADLIVFE